MTPAELRAQHWRHHRKDGTPSEPPISVREGWFRGMYLEGMRRAATVEEKRYGIPEGWMGR